MLYLHFLLGKVSSFLIYGISVLSLLYQFWDTFQNVLANNNLYTAYIGALWLWLPKLQDNAKTKELQARKPLENGEDVKRVPYY